MTVDQFFQLSHQDRMQVKQMFPNRPPAMEASKSPSQASKRPSPRSKTPAPGSQPSGVSKSRKTNLEQAASLITAAQQIVDVIVAEAKQANEGAISEAANAGGVSLEGDPSDDSSFYDSPSHDGSTTNWEKRDGISVSRGVPVIPQGVLDGQIGKTFPWSRHVSPEGIENPGTRCYRLALLQCLFHTPEMYHLLGNVHKDCERNPEECITCALQQMTQDYWNGNRNTNQLNDDSNILDRALKRMIPWDQAIQEDEQYDPYEIMQYFVRLIQADAFGTDLTVGWTSQSTDEDDDNSLSISKAFQFEYQVQWTCTECGTKHPNRTWLETGIDLTVFNARRVVSSLESYIQDPRTNPFLDTNRFVCDSEECKELQRDPDYEIPLQTKRRRIARAPEILTVRLQRFTADWVPERLSRAGKVLEHGFLRDKKSNQSIAYGEVLDLTRYSVLREDDIQYELRGVASHIGTTIQNGHYIAGVYRRSPVDTYSTIDDERVGRALKDTGPLLRPARGTPYVLVYSRIPTEPDSS